jgi:hypothetical protein
VVSLEANGDRIEKQNDRIEKQKSSDAECAMIVPWVTGALFRSEQRGAVSAGILLITDGTERMVAPVGKQGK